MTQFFTWFVENVIQSILNWLVTNWIFTMSCTLTTIICLIWNCIQNPSGAINEFMCTVVDALVFSLPSTPSEYKIGTLLGAIGDSIPQIGWGPVYEIFTGMAGMAGLSIGYRAIILFKP